MWLADNSLWQSPRPCDSRLFTVGRLAYARPCPVRGISSHRLGPGQRGFFLFRAQKKSRAMPCSIFVLTLGPRLDLWLPDGASRRLRAIPPTTWTVPGQKLPPPGVINLNYPGPLVITQRQRDAEKRNPEGTDDPPSSCDQPERAGDPATPTRPRARTIVIRGPCRSRSVRISLALHPRYRRRHPAES